MKKLMIAMTAVALAVSAQAAFYAQIKTAAPGAEALSSTTIGGYSAVYLSASTMASAIGETSLSASDVDKVVAFINKDFDTNYDIVVGKGGGLMKQWYSNSLEFRHPSLSTGNIFGVVTYKEEGEVCAYRVFNMNNKTTIVDDSTTGYWSSWQAVPEPTSGLLLLLGVAGLALKRKRA